MIRLFCFFNLVWGFRFVWAQEAPIEEKPNWKIGATLDSRADLYFLPTSRRGHLAFNTTELRLKLQANLPEKILENQSLNLQYDLISSKLIEGALKLSRLNSDFEDSAMIGIVLRPSLKVVSDGAPQSKFGSTEFFPLARKYAYEDESDKGVVIRRQYADPQLQISLGLLNGEGSAQNETGGGKDVEVVVQYKQGQFLAALSYGLGVYDSYSGSETRKERAQALGEFQFGGELIYIEVLYANDPAQAIEDRQIAEHVDLTAKAGDKIYGLAYRVSYFRRINDFWGLIAQVDTLRPDLSDPKKDFWEGTLAASYDWSKSAKIWAGLSQAAFPEEHSASIRDQQRFSIAMRVEF